MCIYRQFVGKIVFCRNNKKVCFRKAGVEILWNKGWYLDAMSIKPGKHQIVVRKIGLRPTTSEQLDAGSLMRFFECSWRLDEVNECR